MHFEEGIWCLLAGGDVENSTLIPAGKIVIATGARPAVPPIPGIEAVPYLTSTTALDLQELPRSLLVIGGGSIWAPPPQIFPPPSATSPPLSRPPPFPPPQPPTP